MALMLPQAFTL